MRLMNELLKFFVVFLAQSQLLAQDLNSESITVNLGVQVFYDRTIYDNIRHPYGHEPFADNGTPNGYFAAFLSAVELTFRDIKNLNINISLVNSTLLNDDRAREVAVSAPSYYDTIDGKETMAKLRQEVLKHPQLLEEADVLFLVTAKSIRTQFHVNGTERMYLSFGLPTTGGVCRNGSNIGLVTDDGKTFEGVQDAALQLAVLLGAKLESDCSSRGNYMPPSVLAKNRSTLSDCTEEEIREFLKPKKDADECWTKPPNKLVMSKVLPAAYNNITGYDVCTAGTTGRYREVRQCKPGDERERFNRTCHVQCCEYNSRFARNGLSIFLRNQKVGDGAHCDLKKICVFGKCEELSTRRTEERTEGRWKK